MWSTFINCVKLWSRCLCVLLFILTCLHFYSLEFIHNFRKIFLCFISDLKSFLEAGGINYRIDSSIAIMKYVDSITQNKRECDKSQSCHLFGHPLHCLLQEVLPPILLHRNNEDTRSEISSKEVSWAEWNSQLSLLRLSRIH